MTEGLRHLSHLPAPLIERKLMCNIGEKSEPHGFSFFNAVKISPIGQRVYCKDMRQCS